MKNKEGRREERFCSGHQAREKGERREEGGEGVFNPTTLTQKDYITPRLK